jgi:hypothetical protein
MGHVASPILDLHGCAMAIGFVRGVRFIVWILDQGCGREASLLKLDSVDILVGLGKYCLYDVEDAVYSTVGSDTFMSMCP